MRSWVDVATLTRTKSLKGRFVAKCATGLRFSMQEGMEVAFVPPQLDVPRSAVVSMVREIDDERYEVAFDGIDERCADELVGSHCLVRRADFNEGRKRSASLSPFDGVMGDREDVALLFESVEGWTVKLPDGTVIGSIGGFIENPAQTLMEVSRSDRDDPTLIPVVGEFIVSVDENAESVVVDVPEGLLEL